MGDILDKLLSLSSTVTIIILIVGSLWVNNWIHHRFHRTPGNENMVKQSISLAILLLGILMAVLSLPINPGTQGQILSFLGIIISAALALSSTTILGNILAGLMNRSNSRIKSGDLIKTHHYTGRVTRQGLFHTEIQLENSDLVTIPNLQLASGTVHLIRKSKTVISTMVSLGYDIPRGEVEKMLLAAALEADLIEPYLYITELGDFSITYKIHGFLINSHSYFTAQSRLNKMIIDHLHNGKIEIVSPTFMNQRQVGSDQYIPHQNIPEPDLDDEILPEEQVFDKADTAEALELEQVYLKKMDERRTKLQEAIKRIPEHKRLKVESKIEEIDQLLRETEITIETKHKELHED